MNYDLIIDHLQPIKVVEKVWGRELWLVNEPHYCAKLLEINYGYQCSLHFHPVKNETFIVLRGKVNVEVGYVECLMQRGQTQLVPAKTPHRFGTSSAFGAVILEISTHHDDSDVVRIEESRKIKE